MFICFQSPMTLPAAASVLVWSSSLLCGDAAAGYLNKSYPNDPKGKEAKFKELSAYQPMARMGTPKEVAALALFLASDESAFCTGQCYSVDGGVENCWDAIRPKL